MADVVFIAVAVVFFAICVVYVRALDRLVESAADSDGTAAGAGEPADELVRAGR